MVKVMRCETIVISFVVLLVLSSTSIDSVRGDPDNNFVPSDYTPSDPFYIYSDSQLASLGFQGDGSQDTPYLIENLLFDLNETYGSGRAISIWNTRSYITIQNCYIQGKNEIWEAGTPQEWVWVGGLGVELVNVSNVRVENCTFYIFGEGITLANCTQVVLHKNTFRNEQFSEETEGSPIKVQDNSTQVTVSENLMYKCGTGITIAQSYRTLISKNKVIECNAGLESFHFSKLNTISENLFLSNRYEGIVIGRSNDTLVTKNNCSYNGLAGIFLDEISLNVTILLNVFAFNGVRLNATLNITTATPASEDIGFGVWVQNGSSGNNITMNDLIDNNMNAKNDVDGNIYDKNYYSDYVGVDADNDLFGDTPYNIMGDAPTYDNNPRMNRLDFEAPTTPTMGTDTTSTATDWPENDLLLLSVGMISGFVIICVIVIVMKKR